MIINVVVDVTHNISYSDLLQVTDLTEFLIEHWEILGDNIPNLLDIDEGTLPLTLKSF